MADEEERARLWVERQRRIRKARRVRDKQLRGSKQARRDLQRDWQPLIDHLRRR